MRQEVQETRILLVEDDRSICGMVCDYLEGEGYRVEAFYDGRSAIRAFPDRQGDALALIDLMLPDVDGMEVIRSFRQTSTIPIIIITAKDDDADKAMGLNLGADDYVEKPYNPAELMARVKAHLRRYRAWGGEAPKEDADRIVNGGLVLDKKQRIIEVEGEEVRLTATEYKILELLMEHPGQVFSAEQIYENVWQETATYAVENTVMVHIRHIREKIEIDTKKPRYVKVVWGIGYKMERYR